MIIVFSLKMHWKEKLSRKRSFLLFSNASFEFFRVWDKVWDFVKILILLFFLRCPVKTESICLSSQCPTATLKTSCPEHMTALTYSLVVCSSFTANQVNAQEHAPGPWLGLCRNQVESWESGSPNFVDLVHMFYGIKQYRQRQLYWENETKMWLPCWP